MQYYAHYIIVSKEGKHMLSTISHQRKGAIHNFLKGNNWTWERAKKYGWKVVKCNVSVDLI